MCDQQRLRSACAYVQSDQSLCKSLEYSMNVMLLTEHHLEFLSLTRGCTGSSESTLVKMPHCWKSMSRLICFLLRITDGAIFFKKNNLYYLKWPLSQRASACNQEIPQLQIFYNLAVFIAPICTLSHTLFIAEL